MGPNYGPPSLGYRAGSHLGHVGSKIFSGVLEIGKQQPTFMKI
jgi:hypothetical protein